MYFDDDSFMDKMDILVGKSININDKGYIFGNMFKDEYKPYKDYKIYKLKSETEEGNLKLKIMEETFIVNDLNLYLDIHPNNSDIYKYFTKHERILNEYINEYQNKYGSICLNSQKNYYDWANGPWPWEDKNV